MKTIFVCGGICSGKTTVAQYMEQKGACRIDLDDISRAILVDNQELILKLVQRFGADILQDGLVDRRLLAQRAFACDQARIDLEEIEIPYIKEQLMQVLSASPCDAQLPHICVVEVPLLDRIEDMLFLADEIVGVVAPYEVRLKRAIGRNFTLHDFQTRLQAQPTDDYICQKASHIFVNDGNLEKLLNDVNAWWQSHIDAV